DPSGGRRAVGPGYVLAPGGAPTGPAVLRGAGRAGAGDPGVVAGRPGRRDPLRTQPGLGTGGRDRGTATAAGPGPGRPAHLRRPAGPALRAALPRVHPPGAASPDRGGGGPAGRRTTVAEPVAADRPDRRAGRAAGAGCPAGRPARLRPAARRHRVPEDPRP